MSLRYRIAVSIFILEAIMIVVVLRQATRGTLESAADLIQESNFTVVALLEQAAHAVLLTEEYTELDGFFVRLGNQSGVHKAMLADRRGIVVAGYNVDIGSTIPDLSDVVDGIWEVRELSAIGRPLGLVGVQFSDATLVAQGRQVRREALGLALFGMSLIAVFGVFMGFLLTRRLGAFGVAAEKLAAGDGDARSGVTGHDEIGRLGQIFDAMADAIQDERRLQMTANQNLRRNHDALQELQEILSDLQLDTFQRVQHVLEVGRTSLKVDVGVLAWIDGDVCEVASVAPVGAWELKLGMSLSLEDSICGEIVQTGTLVTRQISPDPEATRSEFRTHHPHGSYVGIPIRTRGRIVGVLNFIDGFPFDREFTEFDRELVKMMAQFIEHELKRREAEAEGDSLRTQLHQAQKLDAVGRLAGGIAHDFNNLLMVVMGNLDLLDETSPPKEIVERVRGALDAAHRGSALTKRLLAFSRKQTLSPQHTDIGALIESMVDLIRQSTTEAVDIEIVRPDTLSTCEVDQHLLESAILNLVINSSDAMPDGGKLRIECRDLTVTDHRSGVDGGIARGDYVSVTITDSGAGIAPQDLPSVFEPFFSTKGDHGSGLGLSMVYGFVKQTGGSISLESELGVGTTVEMLFQRSRGTPRLPSTEDVRQTADSKGETILLVEDEPEVLNIAVRILRGLGYDVHSASSASAALEVLSQHAIDLLITDVILPGGDSGADLVRKARHADKSLRCLFISGYTGTAVPDLLESNVRLLSKPFRASELANQVRTALDG